MSRFNVLLLLSLMASALYLVNVQYQSRRLFSELDRANAQGRRLTVEYERLQVEKRSQATSARVERLAKSKLGMRVATPAITIYVGTAEQTPARTGSARPVSVVPKKAAP
jgi:cell division protein FtsL